MKWRGIFDVEREAIKKLLSFSGKWKFIHFSMIFPTTPHIFRFSYRHTMETSFPCTSFIVHRFLSSSGSVFISLPLRLFSRVYAFSHFPVYSLTHTSVAVRRGDNLWPRLTWNVSKILMEIITMCTMHVACHFLCLTAIYSQCSQSTRGSSASSSLVRRRCWRKGKLMTFSFSLFVCCCCVCCDRMWAFNVTFWVDVCLFCYVCQAANNMCGSGSQKQHKKLLLGTLLTQMFQLSTQQ